MSRSSSRSSSNSHHRHGISRRASGRLGLAAMIDWLQRIGRAPDDNRTTETTSLLQGHHLHLHHNSEERSKASTTWKTRAWIWTVLVLITIVVIIVLVFFPSSLPGFLSEWLNIFPTDPTLAALAILKQAPVIDGHIDLPSLVRSLYRNNISSFDLASPMPGHVDIPRLRAGRVGGFFWSVYASCPPELEGHDFLNASWRVRDTLEQIDVAKLLISKYSDTFQLALGSSDIKTAISQGKIASLLGVEGGHQLGNSLAVLRQYHSLGVRYVTLTHMCHNVFADSCGFLTPKDPLHGGLSNFGFSLIEEMNRLGILVDLSHTSDATAAQALNFSQSPVIWSHSSARYVHNVARNVPDEVLRLVGTGPGQTDGVIMVNFAPQFVATDGNATLHAVVSHIEHIAMVAGKKHVGIGSDYDGIPSTPAGLEDVSKYPALIAELYKRGWSKYDLAGLTGANLLRVLEGAEQVSRRLEKQSPKFDIYPKRTDL